jgi:phosphatidylglycerophosphate synthase
MLDKTALSLSKKLLTALAQQLAARNISANTISAVGFIIGVTAVPLIISGFYDWAIAAILFNRVADGIDGTVARLTKPTDQGAFLDISLDFLFYSSIPLAFAIADPDNNALAASLLLYCFVGTGSTFLAYAILAEKRALKSVIYPHKGFYYLGGLTEASETITFFVLMCLFPDNFALLAYLFSAACLITIITRLVAGYYSFAPAKTPDINTLK